MKKITNSRGGGLSVLVEKSQLLKKVSNEKELPTLEKNISGGKNQKIIVTHKIAN